LTSVAPERRPTRSTRECVRLYTWPQACQSCHGMINPLGCTMEPFEAVGRFQNDERGNPIDATGMYLTRAGEPVKFAGVRDLAAFLAESEETQEAFVQRLFHYLVKQPVHAFGSQELTELREAFAKQDFNIRKLMVEVIASSALIPRASGPKTKDKAIPLAVKVKAKVFEPFSINIPRRPFADDEPEASRGLHH